MREKMRRECTVRWEKSVKRPASCTEQGHESCTDEASSFIPSDIFLSSGPVPGFVYLSYRSSQPGKQGRELETRASDSLPRWQNCAGLEVGAWCSYPGMCKTARKFALARTWLNFSGQKANHVHLCWCGGRKRDVGATDRQHLPFLAH